MVFAWDVPVVSIVRPDLLARVGGFFFTRAGQPVSVLSLAPDTNRVKVDANYPIPALLRQEGTQARGAVYLDIPAGQSAPAMAKQPNASLKGRFTCRNYAASDGVDVVLACIEAVAKS